MCVPFGSSVVKQGRFTAWRPALPGSCCNLGEELGGPSERLNLCWVLPERAGCAVAAVLSFAEGSSDDGIENLRTLFYRVALMNDGAGDEAETGRDLQHHAAQGHRGREDCGQQVNFNSH